MSKKTRGANFCSSEKEILIQLVVKHKLIVENKKTDAVTIARKNEGWKVITQEFNSLSTFNVRSTDQLRTCWDNLKRNTRKDKAATKKEIFGTGGGRPDNPSPGPFQGQVEILLGPTLDGLPNVYDSDAQFEDEGTGSYKPKEDTEEILPEIMIFNHLDTIPDCSNEIEKPGPSGLNSSQTEAEDSNKEKMDSSKAEDNNHVWNGWSPAALKTKMSDALSTKKKESPSWLHRGRPRASMADTLLTRKMELIEILKKNAEIEAEKKNLLLEEQLKQEKIRTELLELQLLMAKNVNNKKQ